MSWHRQMQGWTMMMTRDCLGMKKSCPKYVKRIMVVVVGKASIIKPTMTMMMQSHQKKIKVLNNQLKCINPS